MPRTRWTSGRAGAAGPRNQNRLCGRPDGWNCARQKVDFVSRIHPAVNSARQPLLPTSETLFMTTILRLLRRGDRIFSLTKPLTIADFRLEKNTRMSQRPICLQSLCRCSPVRCQVPRCRAGRRDRDRSKPFTATFGKGRAVSTAPLIRLRGRAIPHPGKQPVVPGKMVVERRTCVKHEQQYEDAGADAVGYAGPEFPEVR